MRNLEQSDRDQAIAARDQHQVRELKIFEGSRAFAIFARDQHKVRAENFFKGSRARSLIARDQTLKIVQRRQEDKLIAIRLPVDRDQYRGFRKIRPINSRISLILSPKSPQILSTLSETAEIHNPIDRSCQNRP